jgi:hypothetical protein
LNMENLLHDPGVMFRTTSCGNLVGLILTYVDDLLIVGDENFLKLSQRIEERFQSRPRIVNCFAHAGVDINHAPFRISTISQFPYSAGIAKLPNRSDFEAFRSARAKLQWLVNTRPDIAGAVAILTQVTHDMYVQTFEAHNRELNRIIRYSQRNAQSLKYLPIDISSTCIVAYSDASYASNQDRTSQLGYVLTLKDAKNVSHIIAYSSKKSPRVVSSIFSGEAIALANAFNHSFALQHDIYRMTGRKLSICLRTDSLAVFDAISKNTAPKDQRLQIDIAQLRESWQRREIGELAFIRSRLNIADSLTKRDSSSLLRVLQSGLDEAELEQWITKS